MGVDADGTLAALRDIGYRQVELAGLYGGSAKTLRAMLDRHELAAPSGHVPLDALRQELPRLLDEAATLGHRWLVCPWIDARERTPDGYRAIADSFNEIGARVAKFGLRFGYHNHAFEFDALPDGTLPYDLLLSRCDTSLVDMELDLFWMVKGGHDPLHYIARHPGRFPMVHAKDMDANLRMVDVGKGQIDFTAILGKSSEAGIRHVFVEHDEPAVPLESARVSFNAIQDIFRHE